MPILKKEIISVGTYYPNVGGQRVKKEFDKQYLLRLAKNANNMMNTGLRIPAPFDHHKDAEPLEVNGAPKSAFNNAGYSVKYKVANNDKGVPTLVGFFDVPGNKTDTNSAYYKALNTAKEVSLSIRDEYRDGTGTVWKDAIMHCALVNHAVVPGQKEFQEMSIINMSMLEGSEEPDISLLGQIRSVLAEACNIVIPASNSVNTFLRDLLVAASQIKANRPTDGQELQPVPIYMSINGDNDMALTKDQATTLVATKAVNPTTKAPFTMEDLGFKEVAPLNMSTLEQENATLKSQLAKAIGMMSAFSTKLANDTKIGIQSRINALIAKGLLTKEYADAHLAPKLEYQMSTLSDGTLAPHQLETTLSTLEALPANNVTSTPKPFEGFVQPQPFGDVGTEMSSEDMNKALNEFAQFIV